MIEILEHTTLRDAAEPIPVSRLRTWAGRRSVPLALIVAVVVIGMAYSFGWGPIVRHHPFWLIPGDIWGTLRTSQFVTWGDIGDVYNSGGGLVTLPGISVVLVPVAFLVSHFALSVSFPYGLAHPAAWLVLGPYMLAIGAIVLIPLDALAEELGIGRRARIVASVCEMVVLWPVVAIWGHPEDPLALAFAIWALIAIRQGRWRAAGWLVGLALVTQPLVVLMIPVCVAMMPRREWPKFALRGVLPSAALLVIPLAQSWSETTTALLKQPNYPTIDHPTPWLALAPVLTKTHPAIVQHFHEVISPTGYVHFIVKNVHTVAGETVAAGPSRLIALGLALVLGFYAYRRPPSFEQAVWLCCLALALRCVFEAVMDPYYLWPPLAFALLLAVRDRWRFPIVVVAAGAATWWSYRFTGPWQWWVPIVVLLALAVTVTAPQLSAPARQRGRLGVPRVAVARS